MSSNLILYTPRTGSTFFSEIISVSSGCINLSEGLVDSCVSPFNSNQLDSTNQWDAFKPSLQQYIFNEVIQNGRYNFVPYHKEKQKRIDILKSRDNWTIKETCSTFLTNIDFIQYCCNSTNVNVYMMYRRDVISQFRSLMNMSKRKSVYTSDEVNIAPPNEPVSDETILGKTPMFAASLVYWRMLYERFRSKVTLVCYEDVIKPMNFSSLGISDDVVKTYNMRYNHLIPTPFEYVDRTDPTWKSAVNAISDLRWITNTL
jgi:hypothetical protein